MAWKPNVLRNHDEHYEDFVGDFPNLGPAHQLCVPPPLVRDLGNKGSKEVHDG